MDWRFSSPGGEKTDESNTSQEIAEEQKRRGVAFHLMGERRTKTQLESQGGGPSERKGGLLTVRGRGARIQPDSE